MRGKTRWATSRSRLETLLAREHAGENRRVRLIRQKETLAGAMYSPRLVKEVLKALGKQLVDDGWLDSVSLYSAGPTVTFLSCTHKNGTNTISKEICSTQSRSRKKRGNRLGLKAKAL